MQLFWIPLDGFWNVFVWNWGTCTWIILTLNSIAIFFWWVLDFNCASLALNQTSNRIVNSNINLDLGFSEIKDRITVPNPLNPSIKIFAEQSMNQTASNLSVESPLARSNMPTNWSDNEQNNTITLRDFHENQITREPRISVAWVSDIFYQIDFDLVFRAIFDDLGNHGHWSPGNGTDCLKAANCCLLCDCLEAKFAHTGARPDNRCLWRMSYRRYKPLKFCISRRTDQYCQEKLELLVYRRKTTNSTLFKLLRNNWFDISLHSLIFRWIRGALIASLWLGIQYFILGERFQLYLSCVVLYAHGCPWSLRAAHM